MTTSYIGGRYGLQNRKGVAGAESQKRPLFNYLLIADIIFLCFAAQIAWWFRFIYVSHWLNGYDNRGVSGHNWAFLGLYILLFILFAYARGVYSPPRRPKFTQEVFQIVGTSLATGAALSTLILVTGDRIVSRGAIGVNVIISVMLLVAWRAFLRFPGVSGLTDACNVLIVGAGPEGKALQQYLIETPHLGYSVMGFIDRRVHSRESGLSNAGPAQRVLGPISELDSIIRTHFIDEVLITLPTARDLIKEVVARARLFGTQVRVVPDLYDGLGLGAPVESVGHFPTLTLNSRAIPALQLTIKRSFDAICSAVALLFFSPLFLLIAVLIRFDSEGPVFYNSVRLGKKGKTFICHKFRTMSADAEARKESLRHLNEREAILFKISDDPRVTKLGRFLRKWSLDELPQLWNVMKGDMSLVGPRPPIPDEFKRYSVAHLRRLEVVPGLTGLWQVQSRQSPSFEDYIQLDIRYVDSWSIWLDMTLIVKTFYVVLAGTGR